jgi:hypothetical protein
VLARAREKTELEDFGEKLSTLLAKAEAALVTQYAADHSQYALAFGKARGLRDALNLLQKYTKDRADE